MRRWPKLSTGSVEDTVQFQPPDEVEPGQQLDGMAPVYERPIANDVEAVEEGGFGWFP
jgi:hypothetical protein